MLGETKARFRLLGALEVGQVERLGGPRQRAVLAALLLRANDTASIGYLTRAAWDNPPRAPESNLRTYVAGLRKALRDERAELVTRGGGYCLLLDPAELDMARFEQFAQAGGNALRDEDFATAAAYFRQALDLWRGQPLEGQAIGPALQAEIGRLQDRRFEVIEQHCQANLELGNHASLVAELQSLVGQNPLREDLSAQLMLALHRSSRRAEALEVFRETRARLVRELGIEPGPRLQSMQREILDCGPVAAPARSRTRPRRLPMDIADFTGRYDELARLRRLVDEAVRGPVTVCVIEGMAGVGKTRLAIHAAHRFAADGDIQLWADLRGFDGRQRPAEPSAVLGTFLHALGVSAEQVPRELDERAALFRERLAGSKALVVLDNAVSEEQVRPLLPGGPESLVLVTTRCSLAGLDGAVMLGLDVFSEPEAVELMARVLGPERIAAEPEAAARVARLCGYLPLAVTLAARRLRGRSSWRLVDLADRLERDRLDQLDLGDRGVRTVFEMSYKALTDEQRRLFRQLGAHPGDDFTAESAAALAGLTPRNAELILDHLLDFYLLEQITPGRYRFHDLVRDFARDCLRADETPAAQADSVRRALEWFTVTADAADRALQPSRHRVVLEAVGNQRQFDQHQAMQWFEAENDNLVSAVQVAADHGCHRHAWQLPSFLLSWFYRRRLWADWTSTYTIGLAAARQLADRTGEAMMLNGLGVAHSDLDQYVEAIACHQQALVILRVTGDRAGQAWNLNNLGVALGDIGRFDEAVDCFQQALTLHEDAHGKGLALSNLGDAYRALGRLDQALTHLRKALRLQWSSGDRAAQRYTRSCLGDVYVALGKSGRAVEHYRQALAASRETGDRWQAAIVLARLADALGEGDQAEACRQEAGMILDDLRGGPKSRQLRQQLGDAM
ncbi:AfsR/SARP family transcriptional regulator [Kribbella deserti]|uniref:BTAD domain-containing putative transcriptional regulator n=1 Tax=Kribbella deserti TaxID=1926257 RepID=A0ABV6QTC4_9ACTN